MSTYAYLPIEIISGDDFRKDLYNKSKNCETGVTTAIDLSSVTAISGQIYDLNGAVLETLTCVVEDASAGHFSISLTDTQTAALSGASTTKITEKIGRHRVWFVLSDGTIETKLIGPVSLTKVLGA